jgi:hypothetical protein
VLALAIAIPLLAIVQVQVRSTHRGVEENEARRGAALARLGATAVDEYLRGIADYAEAYAEHPGILEGANRRDERAVRAILARLIQGNPRVDRTFVTDLAGVEWSDYPNDPSVIGKSFAFRDWFRGVSSGETTYVSSSYRRMAGRQERSIAIATPIRSGEARPVAGYLVAQVLVSSLERQLAQPVKPDSGGIVVIDRDLAVVTELGFPPGSGPGSELDALVRAKDGGRLARNDPYRGRALPRRRRAVARPRRPGAGAPERARGPRPRARHGARRLFSRRRGRAPSRTLRDRDDRAAIEANRGGGARAYRSDLAGEASDGSAPRSSKRRWASPI